MDFPKTTPRHSFEFALWTAEQLAEFLNVKRRRIYELVREGRMPSIRIGRTLRFDPGQIQAWLGQRSSAKAAPERGSDREARQKRHLSVARPKGRGYSQRNRGE